MLVVFPRPSRRFDKSDFDDLARAEGIGAVRERIASALSARPAGRAPLVTVVEARARVREAVAEFFRQAAAFSPDDDVKNVPPPVQHGIRVGVGVGKSAFARAMAANMLAEMRSRGDMRSIVFAVPTHGLGDEQAEAFEALPMARAHRLRAAVWRGREAPDPTQRGKAICHDLEAVKEAQSVGADVERSVCFQHGRGTTPTMCQFFGVCGYQRQKRTEADLWIGAHELLFAKKPGAIAKVAVVVVDEAAWRKGLQGVDSPDDLTLDTLRENVVVLGDVSSLATRQLREAHWTITRALDRMPDGPVIRTDLAEHISRGTAAKARALSWRRVQDPGLVSGMTASERKERVRAVGCNRTAMRLARVFGSAAALLADDGPEASGWLSLATVATDDGSVRVLRLRGRREIAKGWQAPTLILDALLDPRLVAPYWPQLEVTAEIEADASHMRVRQMTGRDWAKSALVPDGYANDGEIKRRAKNCAQVRAVVLREARATGGKTLVVTQLAAEGQWRSTGAPLPASIDLAHHNAVAGRDQWGPGPGRDGVHGLIVVGRTLPRPGDVERMAEALTGRACSARVARYERHETPIEMQDGSTVMGEADRHPDPIAEAIRWQICEGELVQIIGRARRANRSAADPVEVLVLTDRPLPLPVDELVPWASLAPSPADMMLSAGGVALECAADASRAYQGLWPTPEAARNAFQRTSAGHSPLKNYLQGNVPHSLRRATYQRTGERQRPAVLVYDPELVPDLAKWLTARLGPLGRCDVTAGSEVRSSAPNPVTTGEMRPPTPPGHAGRRPRWPRARAAPAQ